MSLFHLQQPPPYGDLGHAYRRQNKPKPRKNPRNNGDGGGVVPGKGRGRGLTIETEDPSPGDSGELEGAVSEEYTAQGQGKLSPSDSVSDTSSSEEDIAGEFSDAKETLSPSTDYTPRPTDFQVHSDDVVSSYHEGGYELPVTHTGPPYNGGVDHSALHTESQAKIP